MTSAGARRRVRTRSRARSLVPARLSFCLYAVMTRFPAIDNLPAHCSCDHDPRNLFTTARVCMSRVLASGNLAHQAIQIRRRENPGPGGRNARRRSGAGADTEELGEKPSMRHRNSSGRYESEAEREAKRMLAEVAAKAEADAMNAEIERRKAKVCLPACSLTARPHYSS
jgi:hypothetical protein